MGMRPRPPGNHPRTKPMATNCGANREQDQQQSEGGHVMEHVFPPLGVLTGLCSIALGVQVIRTARRLRASGQRVPGMVVRLRFDPSEYGGG
jgi:hypothetical protein